MELISLVFGLLCTPLVALLYCFIADWILHWLLDNKSAFAHFTLGFILILSLLSLLPLVCDFYLQFSLGAKEADARYPFFIRAHIFGFLHSPASLATLIMFPYRRSTQDESEDKEERWARMVSATIAFTILAWIEIMNVYAVSDALHGVDGMGETGG
jgi:hypothetical protein